MNKTCARCEKIVYPTEELKCLDKVWHKGCFKCQECGMTLNMKTYKGYGKLPYCEAHVPKAKHTTMAETPELKRIAENTKIQSNVKYHADFEKSKGKFTQVADDPETLRIKANTKIISNVAYHGDLEKKAQMEKQRIIYENGELLDATTDNYHQQIESYATEMLPPPPKAYNPPPPVQNTHNNTPQNVHNNAQNVHNNSQNAYTNSQNLHSTTSQNVHSNSQSVHSNSQNVHSNSQNMHSSSQNVHSNPQHMHSTSQLVHSNAQNQNSNHNNIQQNVQTRQPYPQEKQYTQQPPQQYYNNQPSQQNKYNEQSYQYQKYDEYQNQYAYGQYAPPNYGVGSQQKIGRIQDYDPLSDGPRVAPNTQRASATLIYNSTNDAKRVAQQGQQQQQQSRPVGRVTDLDPMANEPARPASNHHSPLNQRVYVAMYDYEANDSDEVSFREGDYISNVTSIDEGWITGQVLRTGRTGMLPANYVEPAPMASAPLQYAN